MRLQNLIFQTIRSEKTMGFLLKPFFSNFLKVAVVENASSLKMGEIFLLRNVRSGSKENIDKTSEKTFLGEHLI